MRSVIGSVFLLLVGSNAFAPFSSGRTSFLSATVGNSRMITLRKGSMEQIEFKIYPDGRIEEVVRGVKGGDCHKITEEINKNLGKVVHTKPTEEMFEEKITIDQTVQVKNDNGWESSSSW